MPAFRANEIDWDALPKLSAEDLKDLGVVLGGHRRRLLDAIAFGVKPNTAANSSNEAGHARRSRGDDGCLQFDVMLPNGDDEHVFLVEKWRDQDALDEHAKGPMPGATYRDWIVGRKVARGAPAD